VSLNAASPPQLSSSRLARRAYLFGIVNGVLFNIGTAFIDPATVLPALVSTLTTSTVLIGAISALGNSGWYLPQIVTAGYLQSRPYKRPLYLAAASARLAVLIALIPVVYLLGTSPGVWLALFFLGYAIYSIGGGISGPPFLDIVAKTIPGHKVGAFFGHRQFWGGLGGIGAGLLVKLILESPVLAFPKNYALLFLIAVGFIIPSFAIFAFIHEPPGKVASDPLPIARFLHGLPQAIRQDRRFRLMLLASLLTGAIGLAGPFYIVYARTVLHLPAGVVGTYTSLQMLGAMVLVPMLARLNDTKGPRAMLCVVTLLALIASLAGLAAALLPSSPRLGAIALAGVFFFLVAVGFGSFTGFTSYLFRIAPEEHRTRYIGIHNTLFAFTCFLPLAGGAIIAATSYAVLFLLAVVFAMLAGWTVLRLPPIAAPPSG
jgi:MFS family permease